MARESACKQLIDSDFTHILMLDADHKHPPNIIQQLARWVIEDPERLVVGGLNFRRSEPYDPCAYMVEDDKFFTLWDWEEGLLEVDRIGTGSILIAREVFERLKQPWFYLHSTDEGATNWPTDDMIFCLHCKEAGIKLWCDTTTQSPHMTQAFIAEETYKQYINDHPDKYPVSEAKEE